MKTPRSCEPLWVISFDHSLKDKPLKEKAFFCVAFPHHIEEMDENEKFALDFLEKMSASFKDITEIFLEDSNANETNKAESDEIKSRFKNLEQWIKWLRNMKGDPPEMPPETK